MTQAKQKPKAAPAPLKVFFADDWSQIRRKPIENNWIVVKRTHSPQELWITTYANLAGSTKLLHAMPAATIQTVIDGLGRGLPTNAVDRVTELIGINRTTLSGVLDVSPRALSRRDTLKASTSNRLFRLSALFQKALEVLGEPEEAKRWFTTPKKALGGKTPMEFSETDVGAREVEDLLGRIEYGVYA
jgi:putative toxin-antitoxin system antitoxin component (TIGR02293 family)